MRPITSVLLEAIMVGISLIPVMYVVFYGYRAVRKQNLNLVWTAFLSGALIHVLYELVGLNKYYVETIYPDTVVDTVAKANVAPQPAM